MRQQCAQPHLLLRPTLYERTDKHMYICFVDDVSTRRKNNNCIGCEVVMTPALQATFAPRGRSETWMFSQQDKMQRVGVTNTCDPSEWQIM